LDFFKSDSSYPTYLYYNPYKTDTSVQISLSNRSDLFNPLTGNYIAKNVSGVYSFNVVADDVSILVVGPAKSKVAYKARKIFMNKRFISYQPK
jgi:hypothetical protein